MREKYKRQESDNNRFWQSYSDMMASMLLVVVLVLAGTILNAQKNYEEKEKQLNLQEAQISELQESIDEQQSWLDTERKTMDEQASIIEDQKHQLEQIVYFPFQFEQFLSNQFYLLLKHYGLAHLKNHHNLLGYKK